MTGSRGTAGRWLLRWGISTAAGWGLGWFFLFPAAFLYGLYAAGLVGLAAGADPTDLSGPDPARELALTLGILIAYPLAAASLGAWTGVAQWLALRRKLARPLLWILFSGWAEAAGWWIWMASKSVAVPGSNPEVILLTSGGGIAVLLGVLGWLTQRRRTIARRWAAAVLLAALRGLAGSFLLMETGVTLQPVLALILGGLAGALAGLILERGEPFSSQLK